MRIHHRLQTALKAMGAWAALQRKELTERVGALKANILLGPGRYRRDHPKGAGAGPKRHTRATQASVGSRAFNRQRIAFFKNVMKYRL